MAKAKVKKGQKLSCVPCGREVVVSSWGSSATTIWCCGRPMKKGAAKAKKAKKKAKKR
jgi:hypothetical protein